MAVGTLYVFDNFNANKTDHGDRVVRAARHEGFNGPIVEHSKPERLDLNQDLYTPSMPGADFSKSLRADMARLQVKSLEMATGELKSLENQGVKNSVVNFSSGMSKASVVDQYYKKMYAGIEDAPISEYDPQRKQKEAELVQSKALFNNFARAANQDPEKLRAALLNPDKRISGPAEQRMKQALAGQMEKAAGGQEFKQAKAQYDEAVVSFEKNHNSVVVAAENSGDISRTGKSADFYDNILSTPQTTTVGAVSADGKQIESYSNPSKNVKLYARGQSPRATDPGTSYSAPRAAAAMTKAHALNQQMSSEEVERLVEDQLTTNVPGTTARELDSTKTAAYFNQK
ncbi:MAG: S8/S53 family peptidase [Candidatus Eremiobacteraeota bacterium]|nr:S8/S53 family peptidase [Candidatus Eremiobacteraeota bacterium]MCW5868715.1 S8/S53 family peptidase [Candidatus Eremiobacteraeota bacterium]